MAQTLILLSTSEFNMVRLNDRHCTGSSIMPQKRNPCSLEVIKAKTSFAHGMVVSLLSAGKSLFMGYNRDTQWTKYWIMDLVEESKPVLPVMSEVIQLLQVNQAQMLEQTHKEFAGATSLMEWMVRPSLPLAEGKDGGGEGGQIFEKEGKGKVSYRSLKSALDEMKIDLPVTEEDVKEMQRTGENPFADPIRRDAFRKKGKRKYGFSSSKDESKTGHGWSIRKGDRKRKGIDGQDGETVGALSIHRWNMEG